MFNKYTLDKDLFEHADDGFCLVKEFHYSNSAYSLEKTLIVKEWLPEFVKGVVDDQFLSFDVSELANYDTLSSTTAISCPNFPQLRCSLNKSLVPWEWCSKSPNQVRDA